MRLFVLGLVVLVACQRTDDKKITTKPAAGSGQGSGSAATAPAKPEQIAPPVDLNTPPFDAVKTSSGLIYKKLSSLDGSIKPKRNDTVLINYTGWRQSTGETFFTNRGKGQPMPLPLSNTAPGFTEAMQLIGKGEKAMLWLPPNIGYKGAPQAGTTAETLVYEVEVVEIMQAPAVPAQLVPPAKPEATKSGIPYVVVTPGTGKDKVRNFDTVTFNYSAWDKDGRMFDSTEMRKRPAIVPPYRQAQAMEEVLTQMVGGERVRTWIPSEKLTQGGKSLNGMPDGLLTYEIEVITIEKGKEPPPTPSDVAKPPSDTKKSPKGVFYKVLKQGKGGPHPQVREKDADTVTVNYTGWSTEGRMFDSSVVKGEPATFALNGVIMGWTDVLPLMSVGDRFRIWVPEDLAYKGAIGRQQGMLVFEIELLEIKPLPAVEAEDPKAAVAAGKQPAPSDVAAPPADAKKSPRGVFYKILKPVPGAAHPSPTARVKVQYTGWTTDGQMFDSSRTRGEPYDTLLKNVIAGWQDGIPQIGVGEQARLWIPKELAYPDGGGPQGMLVFDIELVEIKPQ